MAYSSTAVANHFIEKALKEGTGDLSPMKLQKLVYFAHGWYLALNKEPLLIDRIEAWQFGPVISKLYHETKKYGNSNITSLIAEDNSQTPKIKDTEVKEFLDNIWNTYSKYSAAKLSNATHLAGTPWAQVFDKKSNAFEKNMIINDNIIEDYFTKKISSTV